MEMFQSRDVTFGKEVNKMIITGTALTLWKAYKAYTTVKTVRNLILDKPVSLHAAKGTADRGADALGVLIDGDCNSSKTERAINVATTFLGI